MNKVVPRTPLLLRDREDVDGKRLGDRQPRPLIGAVPRRQGGEARFGEQLDAGLKGVFAGGFDIVDPPTLEALLENVSEEQVRKVAEALLANLSDEQVKKAAALFAKEYRRRAATEIVTVTVDNYVEAETATMFDGILFMSGGVNEWLHNREPVALDEQNVIRMNRDTLYSSAIVDISEGASVTLPDAGERYRSLMVLNEGHYINAIWHDPGTYELTVDEFDTERVAVVLRTFVDPNDPADLEVVHALQDAVTLEAGSAKPYEHPVYDEATHKTTGELIRELGSGIPDSRGMFGRRDEVDPIRHLFGTAGGWGGLPEHEAFYIVETEPRDVGHFTMTLKDVPFDGFWSLSIYNRDGFFEENPYNSYSANNVTSVAGQDGTVTLNLSPDGAGLTNHLYIMDGWNYALRIYRPRPAVLDGSWTAPSPEPAN